MRGRADQVVKAAESVARGAFAWVEGVPPTPAFAAATLGLAHIAPGAVFSRIYRRAFPNPLGFGRTRSRFCDPSCCAKASRFGGLSLGPR